MSELRLDLTSDFICPWCFIAEERLRAAARRVETLRLDLHWHPFELNPTMPREGMDRRAYRTRKFGSWERSFAMDEHVAAVGRADGVTFDFARIQRTPNTRLSHRLMWFAAERGLHGALAPAIFRAYFTEGRDIGQSGELVTIGAKAGLDPAEARDFLEGEQGTGEVVRSEERAMAAGVNAVPHLEIAGRAFNGARDTDELVLILRRFATRSGEARP